MILRPSPKQLEFLMAREKYVAYGGARGGGKSWAVQVKATAMAGRYPGIKELVIRRTFRELENNHIEPLKRLLAGRARYNRNDKKFAFANGSTIQFGYCDNDADVEQYQGAEYDVIYIDEATNLKEDWLKKIIICCRGVNPYPHRVYYTCNPGGVSHAYIKRLFVDRVYTGDEHPEDYRFIPAKVTDNAALMAAQPEYMEQLKSLPPKLRAAWLEGSWDIFEGMVFEDFRDDPDHYLDRRWTHVIEPFAVPRGWEVYRSFDWGYHHPFSCGWWAVDYDGILYRIAELYGCQYQGGQAIANEGLKWSPDRVFAEIQRMEHEHPLLAGREIRGVADPAIWDAESGISFAETAAKYGIYFQKGDHKRIPGWMQMHYRLQFDGEGIPQMYIFRSCRDFIRTIPTLQYDAHRPEDIDTDGEDHIADETRYMCMARPIKPVVPEETYMPLHGANPLDQDFNVRRI